ncbi:MAG: twin-arginine translocase subunit TatC [Candidatus Riflebacteria bacterium]|nr:twin-arginine translocase subunit TatC [Candidatus Riflebacteria bacterium]
MIPETSPEPPPAERSDPDDGLALPGPDTTAVDGGDDEKVMSLTEHLTELRTRILTSLAAIALMACGTLWFSADLTRLIVRTAPKIDFIALTPMEVFYTELKIGLLTALILAIPVVFWQVWAFVRPGLKRSEQRVLKLVVPLASVLFAVGASFAYGVVVPLGVQFLASFSLDPVKPQYSLEAYTSFVLFFVLAFGLTFESPMLLLLLAKVGVVTRQGLARRRRHVILGCFIVSAILTPTPDIFNQGLMALPMWLLFELTLLGMWVMRW